MTPAPRRGRIEHGRGRNRVLVVIGGLPGSGKTTLLRRLLATPVAGVSGYDSEDVAASIRWAGPAVPYRVLRPSVHCRHRWRVVRGLFGRMPVVVLTDPWTSPGWRTAVLVAAALARRTLRVVLVDASRKTAEAGQAARGRTLSPSAMRRHAVRWAEVLRTARHPGGAGGSEGALVVDRARADRLDLEAVLDRWST